ncbi:MAG: DNA photolyase family protein [Gemmatales bacterium]|nr:DNA photolyase family protein [Gemmatales bacterium]MDW8388082.1 deoxyribodipyrimidine photo-lyase [Gemmatales bacterium]
MPEQPTAVVWFRQDLRLSDNPALDAAVKTGLPIIPLFVWQPEEEGKWAPASASRWWLHQSLTALDAALRRIGSRLIVRSGPTSDVFRALVQKHGVKAVFWNRRYEPVVVKRDTGLKSELKSLGVAVESYNSALLHEPWTLATQAGKPFQVFTPYWKAIQAAPQPAEPFPAPQRLRSPETWPDSLPIAALELEPKIDWAAGMRASWTPGETGAMTALQRFLDDALGEYKTARDRPDLRSTSRLSPHLHFGEIGPRQIWHTVLKAMAKCDGSVQANAEWYLRELAWREFAYHLLYHFPHTTDQPLRPEFARFPWRDDRQALRAWQKGRTGYPLVDAGMRELWITGWMHNRVRMVVASFLVKHLLIPWQRGAEWFWDTLVDADLANNTLGWQWTAGCGADAAPYFRIFNPVNQGEKFDPNGAYVRRFVPELARLPNEYIHKPWTAPDEILEKAGVRLGETYPRPVVDHALARQRALDAFERIRRS